MDKELYGRAIIIRNCGRFLNIASDFGSEYKTHPFLTEQMVYAGLTRENEFIGDKDLRIEKGIVPDNYDFIDRYNIPNGRYYTSAYLLDESEYEKDKIVLGKKNRDNSDINEFNSIDESSGDVQGNKQLPKFGNIESILPNNYFLTFVFSTEKEYLERYYKKQTFYMGKKRSMFQIEEMSEVVKGSLNEGEEELLLPIQLTSDEVDNFNYYTIMTLTQRYILLKGKTKIRDNYSWEIDFKGLSEINLPKFFVDKYI